MSRLLIAALSVVLLAGCASTKKEPIESVTVVTKPKLNVKDPPPIDLKDVEWIVVTPENQEAVFAKLKADGKRSVLFALTDEGYREIRLNDAKVLGYMKKQKGLIAALRRYYED
jgi:predicted component of type VI protein secretion system